MIAKKEIKMECICPRCHNSVEKLYGGTNCKWLGYDENCIECLNEYNRKACIQIPKRKDEGRKLFKKIEKYAKKKGWDAKYQSGWFDVGESSLSLNLKKKEDN